MPELTQNGDNCKLCEMVVGCEVVEVGRREKERRMRRDIGVGKKKMIR